MTALNPKNYIDKQSVVAPMQFVKAFTPVNTSPPFNSDGPGLILDAAANEIGFISRGVMVTVAGALMLQLEGMTGDEAVAVQVLAKTFYPFAIKAILAGGTTATGITVFQ